MPKTCDLTLGYPASELQLKSEVKASTSCPVIFFGNDEFNPTLMQFRIEMMLFQNFPRLLREKIREIIPKLPIRYGIPLHFEIQLKILFHSKHFVLEYSLRTVWGFL